MKESTKKYLKWILPGAFFVILLALHALIRIDFGDDMVYSQVNAQRSLGKFLQDRYNGWSSRVLIESVMMPLTWTNPWVWRILNSLLVTLLVWNVADLFGTQRKLQAQLLFFAMMWVIPMDSLCSAGWITTTTNYLWALILGLVAIRPLKHWLSDEKCARWEYPISLLCIFYAANMEQMGAILLGTYLVMGLYLLAEKKKLPVFYIVQLLLIILSLLFILSAPGNAIRSVTEAEKWFPEFLDLNVYQKILMGFLETGHYYLAGGHEQVSFLVPLLTGVLLAETIRIRRKRPLFGLHCLIALCPFLFYWGIGQLGNYLLDYGNITRGRNVLGALSKNRQIPEFSPFPAAMVLMQTVCYLILFACIAVTIYRIHGNKKEAFLQLVILAAGFVSRVMMGFSPTIYASGDRTALFYSMAVLLVTMRNLQVFLQQEKKGIWKAVVLIYMGICILCNLF